MPASGNAIAKAPGGEPARGFAPTPVSHLQGRPRGGAIRVRFLGAVRSTMLVVATIATAGAGCRREPEPGAGAWIRDPGVETSGDRTIRVLLGEEINGCRIVVNGPFDLDDAGRRSPLATKIRLPCLSVEFAEASIAFPELGQAFEVEAVNVLPQDSQAVAVEMSEGDWRRYRGSIRLVHTPDRAGAVVNVVDVEDYLIGVVSAELPRSFHEEAFRAQAIAARTYAWYEKQTAPPGQVYDVTATEGSQVYAGLERAARVPQAARAVRDTRGLVCTWSSPAGERIFRTYYSSTCGGSTQAAGPVKNEPIIPPLAGGVKCTYCRHSPAYRWGPVRLEKSVITQRLRDRYPKFNSIGPIQRVEVKETTPAGRPVRLSFADARGRAIGLEAENFRLAVDPGGRVVQSTFFTLRDEGSAVLLTNGRGFGHGLGMCQYGADGLARAGGTAARILRYYYPSSRLARAY